MPFRYALAAVLVAVLALAVSGCYATQGGQPPTYGSGPPVLSSYSVSALPSDEQLTLSWHYATTGGRPNLLHLDLYQVINGAPVRLVSNIVGHIVEPDTYMIPVPPGVWMVRATPENKAGFGTGVNSPFVTVRNPCPAAVLCARVSPSPFPSVVRLAAQGMAHGGVQNSPVMQWLSLQAWRFAGSQSDSPARALHVSRTQVLSDLWLQATAPLNGGYAQTPWSNWASWSTFVWKTVKNAVQGGWSPDYWDIWNEPNGKCCPMFRPTDQGTVSVARWLQAYEIAWKAIRAADPSAKVVGPTLSALQWAPGSPDEFDLNTFLFYSAANGLHWDAVSWHESTVAPSPGDMMPFVTNIDRHLWMARAVMAHYPGIVTNNTIFINEYGGHAQHVLPGWEVGYFRALEDGGVAQGNRACWGSAECGTGLDGLADTTGHVSASWWAAELYEEMAFATRMNVVSTSSWQFDGLATRDDATATVRVLLGRHWSCNRTVNPLCPDRYDVPPASASITVAWPYGTAPVSVSMSRLPAGTGGLPSPVAVGSSTLPPVNGILTIFVPAVNDGDALSVVAHPA